MSFGSQGPFLQNYSEKRRELLDQAPFQTKSSAWEHTSTQVMTTADENTINLSIKLTDTPTTGVTFQYTSILGLSTTDSIGMMNSPEQSASDHHDLTHLWLVLILTVALLTNVLVVIAIRQDRQLHMLTYYFFVSLAILHMLMAVIAMPPAILIALAGKYIGM